MRKWIAMLLTVTALWGVELASTAPDTNETYTESRKVFGYNLFNGAFTQNSRHRYNPEYLLNIGDVVNLQLWGAYEFSAALPVDTQGNIFIPRVGTVHLLGVSNAKLTETIEAKIKQVYTQSVFVYADLQNYQPVSVFVTGSVNKPGLYDGLSSDSVIQFIDKARGIDAEHGSYRHIRVLRRNETVATVDLYDFLLKGTMELFQFQMGDVVVVESISDYVEVLGDVKRPYRFELKEPMITLSQLAEAVLPNPTASNALITSWDEHNSKRIRLCTLAEAQACVIARGESVEFVPDHHSKTITVRIEGEHEGLQTVVVPRGTTLATLMESLELNDFSRIEALRLYRKSIAQTQKELLEAGLRDLESAALTTGSVATEEAVIRQQEAKLILNFVDRARQVQPKGQVVINEDTNLSKIVLEEEDTLYIPKRSNMIVVQGEVMLPGAQTYVEKLGLDDYIASCGGYNFRANRANVLIIRQNGRVLTCDDTAFGGRPPELQPGDAVLVLGKVDSKDLQIVKDITQIIYQIAVGAAVVIKAF